MTDNSTCKTTEIVTTPFVTGFAWFQILGVTLSTIILGWIFLNRRRKYALLRARSPVLLVILILGFLLQLCWAADTAIGGEGFPCVIIYNLILVVVVMGMGPIVINVIRFYNRAKLNRQLANFELVAALSISNDDRLESVNPAVISEDLKVLPKLEMGNEGKPRKRSRNFSIFPEMKSEVVTNILQHVDPMATVETEDVKDKLKDFPSDYLFLLSSERFSVFLEVVLIIVGVILGAFSTMEFKDCVSPCADDYPAEALFVITVFLVATATYFLYKIRNEPDPLRIRRELVLAVTWGGLLGTLSTALLFTFPGDVEEEGRFRWVFFGIFTSWYEILLALGYPLYYTYKQDRLKGQNQLSNVELSEILKTEVGRKRFKAFLVGEFSLENYLFWKEATSYQSEFSKKTEAENIRIRELIIDLYVRNDAKMQVNVSGHARTDCIAKQKHPPTVSDFDLPLGDVFRNMSEDSFTRFSRTSAFQELVGGIDYDAL